MYGSQTVVAEERRRFILLSSQRAKLKSTILAAIKSATMMANTRMGIEDNSMRKKGNSRERKKNSKGWSNKYEEKMKRRGTRLKVNKSALPLLQENNITAAKEYLLCTNSGRRFF